MKIIDISYEQEVIVPILACSYNSTGKASFLNAKVFGTAFFISNDGHFLTCKHVIEQLKGYNSTENILKGICHKDYDKIEKDFLTVIDLNSIEYHPEKFDIAIGTIAQKTRTYYEIINKEFPALTNILAFGYPETAQCKKEDSLAINLRFLKGYIQRNLEQNEIEFSSPHPSAYEINFPIPTCMSGSPLILEPTIIKEKHTLIGICTGSIEAEFTEHSTEMVETNGSISKERRIKVEQYGFALNLDLLENWKPKILNGISVKDLIQNS